jgi:hypothetical protein
MTVSVASPDIPNWISSALLALVGVMPPPINAAASSKPVARMAPMSNRQNR